MRTRHAAAASLSLVLAACSATEWSTETKLEEGTWQALHAVDTLQTVEIARNPACYTEVQLGPIIGYHPSTGTVAAWAAGEVALHAGVTALMEDYDLPRWIRRAWQSAWIGSAANAISVNYQAGLGVGSVDPSRGYQTSYAQCRATYGSAGTATAAATLPMPPRGALPRR